MREWIETIITFITALAVLYTAVKVASIGSLAERIATLEGWLKIGKGSVRTSKSPDVLTKGGKQLIERIEGERYIGEHFDALYKEYFEDINNKLDIQNIADDVLREREAEINEYIDDKAKNYMFENNYTTRSAISALSLLLRDKVIEKKGLGQNKEKIQE